MIRGNMIIMTSEEISLFEKDTLAHEQASFYLMLESRLFKEY